MTSEQSLSRTPLYQEHIVLHAKMVPFGGWEMPLQYEGAGILKEYEQTRKRAALFDISHMGEFIIEGDPIKSGLDKILTQSIVDLPVKSCRYGAILNEAGGVIDDLIVFRLEQEKWFIVVNGATTQKDAQHFQSHLTKDGIFEDVSSQLGKLDIQGPLSRNILSQFVPDIERLEYYTFDFFNLLGENVLISRTGYTGELGYEIYYPWGKTAYLWKALLDSDDLQPAGLGARDLLRIEVGYSLYGHELNEDITAFESGLKRFVDLDKDFIGKSALVEQAGSKTTRRLIGLISESRRSPRTDHDLFDESGKKIGKVSSGTFSPHLNKGIGLGFIKSAKLEKNDTIYFGSKSNQQKGIIANKVFYKEGSIKH